jgi:hypothetical protein
MIPNEAFKLLGLLSITIIWLGLIFVLYRWRGNKSMSFSLHAAQTKSGQLFYFFLFLTTLPLFYLFIVLWFVPTLQLGLLFVALTTVGIIGQFIAVIIPSLPGWKENVHNIAAYIMGLTFIPLAAMIGLADTGSVTKSVALVAVLYMLITPILYLLVKKTHNYYLYFQAVYIAAFHAVVLTATYIS